MATGRLRSGRAGRTTAKALLLFALLCGLALVLARAAPPGQEQAQRLHPIHAVLRDLDRASLAIEEANYGAARAMLRRARAQLVTLTPRAEQAP